MSCGEKSDSAVYSTVLVTPLVASRGKKAWIFRVIHLPLNLDAIVNLFDLQVSHTQKVIRTLIS